MGEGERASHYHGNDGLGDAPNHEPVDGTLIKKEHAVNALLRLVNENPGNLRMIRCFLSAIRFLSAFAFCPIILLFVRNFCFLSVAFCPFCFLSDNFAFCPTLDFCPLLLVRFAFCPLILLYVRYKNVLFLQVLF